MNRFKVHMTYETRSICDHNCIFSFTITRRTEKSVWVEVRGELVRRSITVHDGVETFMPFGSYSMAPIVSAS